MSRGSKLSRMVAFFKEADVEEAQYVLSRAESIMNERAGETQKVKAPVKRRRRKVASPAPEAIGAVASTN